MTKPALLATSIALVLLGTVAPATSAPNWPRVKFEGKVVSVGAPPGFLCGGAMALQPVQVEVTSVQSGAVSKGSRVQVDVLACFGGKWLRPFNGGPAEELDPASVKSGVKLRFDAAQLDANRYLVTDPEIAAAP